MSIIEDLKLISGVSIIKKDDENRIHIEINGIKLGHIRTNKNGTFSWRAPFHGKTWETRKFRTKGFLFAELDKVSTSGIENIEIKPDAETKPKKEFSIKKPKLKFIESNNEVSVMMYAITNGKNTLLKGPTGCGKSFLVEELAKSQNKKLYTVNCDVELDKTEIIGHHEIEDGETVWVEGILIKAMKEGAWIVFDEINMARPEVLSVLHQALDYRRKITIKEHHNEEIVADKDFRVVATINPNYCGTTELNYAFRRRFNVIVDMNYLSKTDERKLIEKRTGIDKETSSRLVSIASDVRVMQNEGKITYPISTAHLLEFGEMLNKNEGINPIDCAKVTLNTSDDFAEMEDILNVVKNYF